MNQCPSKPAGQAPGGNAFAVEHPETTPGSALPPTATAEAQPPRLLDRVRLAIRVRHYSRRTERAYVGWTRRYVLFHHKRHPSEMGAEEIRAFLNYLASELKVSAATQNQALCALVFLYHPVLETEIEHMDGLVRAKRSVHLPVVLTLGEARAVLQKMTGGTKLMGWLLYGSGLRLLECCRLRVKDIDFERREITVHDGKGRKGRMTVLPDGLVEPLRLHLAFVKEQHERDMLSGQGKRPCPCPRSSVIVPSGCSERDEGRPGAFKVLSMCLQFRVAADDGVNLSRTSRGTVGQTGLPRLLSLVQRSRNS